MRRADERADAGGTAGGAGGGRPGLVHRGGALGYTQSAVSRQVAAMEQAAGAPLFERLARGVRPTGAGTVLLRHAAVLLEGVDAATLELGGLRDRLEGRLAVGAYPAMLAMLVPRAL